MKTGHSKRPVNRQLQYKDVGVDKSNGWQPIETAPKDGTKYLGIITGDPLYWQHLPKPPKEIK